MKHLPHFDFGEGKRVYFAGRCGIDFISGARGGVELRPRNDGFLVEALCDEMLVSSCHGSFC